MKEKKYGKNILAYSILFIVTFLVVFFPFIKGNHTLIGIGDGESQYILHLRYMGEWLRETCRGFLHGDFHPDRFDFTIGMGDDIGSVVRFHPLDFLSVFVPGKYTEYLYDFLTIFRCYLAGLSLSAYVLHFKKSRAAALAGAMVYVFCGFTFGLGIVHPTYMSHMILFPMMMLGAEYMMAPERKHSFALFTISIALGFVSNYYFMYISSFGILIYVLIRFFAIYKENRLKNFIRLLVSMALAYLLGLAISAVFLLPSLLRYASSIRASHEAERNSLFAYEDKRRYFAWFLNLITPYEASGNGTHLNFSVTLMPALVLILAGRRKKEAFAQLRKGLFVLLLCLLVPGLGYILAAMNNENNRWVYLISFASAIAVSFTADMVTDMKKEERRLLCIITAVFDLGCVVWFFLTRSAIYHAVSAAELTLYTILLLLLSRRAEKKPSSGSVRLVLAASTVSVMIGGVFTFSPAFGDLAGYYRERGTSFRRFQNSAYAVFQQTPEWTGQPGEVYQNGFYRVDSVRNSTWEDNASLLLKYPGIQMYNSILNADELRMMNATGNIGMTSILHIQSLDGRTVPEELAGVRYFATGKGNTASVPYGYSEEPIAEKRRFRLYENQHPLAFGFTVDSVMDRDTYDNLSIAAGDLAMLESAVVEPSEQAEKTTVETNGLSVGQEEGSRFEDQVLIEEGSLTAGDRVKAEGNLYQTGDKRGSLSIFYKSKPGYECYLSLEGMEFVSGDAMGDAVVLIGDKIRKRIYLSAANSTYTRGILNYTAGLGKTPAGSAETEAQLRIRIPKNTEIRLDKVRFFYLPLEGYEEKVEKMNRNALQDVSFKGDVVTGTADLDQPSYMVFQIPYGKGWTAYVNGEKVRPDKADLCYLGLALDEGISEIRLVYESPGVKTGGFLSLLGLILFFTLCYTEHKVRRKYDQ